VSLITDALQLQTPKKPRAIQVEALPPFSSKPRSWRVVAWVGGLLVTVVAGVWQGPVLWNLLEEASGIKTFQTAPPQAEAKVETKVETTVPAVVEKREMVPEPVPDALVSPSSQEPTQHLSVENSKKEGSPEEVLLPVVVPFQTTDMDEIAEAAAKLRQKREEAVRNLQIQGVRMQGKESRALIEGNPIGLGEAVGQEGIKLKAIERSRILFEDPDGVEYIKSY
jgi:hypothetical protein